MMELRSKLAALSGRRAASGAGLWRACANLAWFAPSLVVASAAIGTSAQADEPPWFEQVQISGMVSTRIDHNFNRPRSRTTGYRVFDSSEGSFSVDVVELVAHRTATKAGEAGFRFDLTAGSAIPRVAAAAGLFRDDQGTAQDFDLQQAFVSWIAPVGRGLRFDVGKQVTYLGYEVIEGYDGWNDQATRSLLFGYAIPFTQTGVRAGYAFGPRLAGALFVLNGWDVARDNNGAKTFGAQLTLTPSARTSLLLNYLGGAEQPNDGTHRRELVDLVAIVKPNDRVTLGLNGDFGDEEGIIALDGSGDIAWKGVAFYARASLTPRWALTARAETFDDPGGFRTGTDQTLKELTVTPEWRPASNLVLRADLRIDRSDQKVFEKKKLVNDTKTQPTVTLNAIVWF